MSQGIQISASGALTALYRQDVFTNNLANLDSIGYKPDIASTYNRQAARTEDNLPFLPSNDLLEKLGAGTMLNPNRVSYEQGSIRTTSSPLDLAIEGDGFFVVQDRSQPGNAGHRLTRDGRFTRDREGTLVMSNTGHPLLDVQNKPIRLESTNQLKVHGDGALEQDGQIVARLRMVMPQDKTDLAKAGHSMFTSRGQAISAMSTGTGTIRQGSLEESAVDEVRALLQMTSAGREVEANIDMMRQHDRMMERAITSLGRVQ